MSIQRFSVSGSILLILLLIIPGSSFSYDILHEYTGYGPGGLAYDELTDTLWYSNMNSQQIMEINPSDGSTGTVLDVSGYNAQPTGLSFRDGVLWSTDQYNQSIHKVDPSDGSSLDSFSGVGGLTFTDDGNLWRGPAPYDNVMHKLDPVTGTEFADDALTLNIQPNEAFIMGLAFDSSTQTFWVANNMDNNLHNVDLDGNILSTEYFAPVSAPDGYQVSGLAFDNNNGTLWLNYAEFGPSPSAGLIYGLAMGATVVPEPVSSILFIAGSATLGLRRYLRKKV